MPYIYETFSYKWQISETKNLCRVHLGSNPKYYKQLAISEIPNLMFRKTHKHGWSARTRYELVLVQEAMKVPRESSLAA